MSFSWTITLWDNDVPPIDHETSGGDRLGWQYKQSNRLKSLLNSFLAETNSLENVCRSMVAQRWPYTAEGVNLDNIGKIIVYDRLEGMTDDEYRLFCLCKIYANQCDCHAEDLIRLLLLSRHGSSGEILRLKEFYPAEIKLQVSNVAYPNTVFTILEFAQPAGVMLDFVYTMVSYDDTFRFDDNLSTVTSLQSNGFGWSGDPSIGGLLSGVKRS